MNDLHGNCFHRLMDGHVFTAYVIAAVVGIPPNLWVIYTVIRWERFHYNRNIIWLGIGASNVFFLLTHNVELAGGYLENETARRALPYLTWMPSIFLVSYLGLALADRYVCIWHSNFYNRHVTLRCVVILQVGIFFVAYLSIKGHYLFGSAVPLYSNEGFRLKLFATIAAAFFITCLLGYSLLAKRANRNDLADVEGAANEFHAAHFYRIMLKRIGTNDNNNPVEATDPATRVNDRDAMATCVSPSIDGASEKSTEPPSTAAHRAASQLDIDAARNLAFSMAFLFIASLPAMVSLVCFVHCLQSPERSEGLTEAGAHVDTCRVAGLVFFYSHALFLLAHSVFNPIFFALYRVDKIAMPAPFRT